VDPHGHGADRQPEPGCCQLVIDGIDGIGGSASPPAGDHADPASRGRVHDVGDLRELLCRRRPAKRSAGWGAPSRCAGQFSDSLLYLAVFAAVLAANTALTNSDEGLWPAGTLVGVTGFEPAASSSRTTSELAAKGLEHTREASGRPTYRRTVAPLLYFAAALAAKPNPVIRVRVA
jgi:hypothetical protein